MRGYKNLKNSNNYKLIFYIKKDLTNIKLKLKKNKFDNFLFLNYGDFNNEIIIRQYILHKFLNSYFNRNILHYFGKKKSKIRLWISS